MNESSAHKLDRGEAPAHSERDWERRVRRVLWTLAALCLLLAGLVWRHLLTGLP